QAVPRLVETLRGDQSAGGWWERLFGSRKSRRDVDQEVNDRHRAAEALAEMGDPSAVDALLEALGDSDRLGRPEAAVDLGRLGALRAVEALLKLLKDRERDVRRRAAEALGELGDLKVVPSLVEVWQQDREAEVRLCAGRVVQRLDPQAAERAGIS